MLLCSRSLGATRGQRLYNSLFDDTRCRDKQVRHVVQYARDKRRTTADEVADVPEEDTPPEQQIVRSSRSSISERRNRRSGRATQQLVTPHQALREMNIVTTDETGKLIVDLSCLGRNEPHWYAVGVVENKEGRYMERLAEVMDEYNISFDPEKLYTPPRPGDTAAQAAADALLQENEVTAWVPSKTMMVYSHNTDKLSERTVHYARGTGGAWVLLYMTLDPLLVDLVQETYYYLGWRHEKEISARMLEQAGLLPPGEDRDEVYKLPVPCTPDVLDQLISWQYTEESEDLEEKRQEFYGIGGGSVFGELPSKAERLQGMERDAAGNTVQKRYSAGTYDNPSGWSEVPGNSSSRGRGGRGSSSRGGRGQGGRGTGRDSWQQQQWQQQDALPWEQPEQQQQQQRGGWSAGGSRGSKNNSGSWDNGGGWGQNDYVTNRSNSRNNRQGGRDPNVRLQQMDYMQEMGSGRYSDEDVEYELSQQQQQGHNKKRNSSYREQQGGWDDDVRLQQMDFMGEMGSGRYSDDDEDVLAGFSGRRGDSQNQAAGLEPRGAGYIGQKGLGGKGDRVRQRQMDYMQEMGSGRYSDADSDDELWGGSGRRNAAAGRPIKRDNKVRHRQMDYMEEMGSERYSSSSDDDGGYEQQWAPSSSNSTKKGGGDRLLDDVAAAFEGFQQTDAAAPSEQQ